MYSLYGHGNCDRLSKKLIRRANKSELKRLCDFIRIQSRALVTLGPGQLKAQYAVLSYVFVFHIRDFVDSAPNVE